MQIIFRGYRSYKEAKTMKRYMMIILLVAMILFGCTVQGQPNQKPDPGNTVTISDYLFEPLVLIVPPGTTVTWYNQDSVSHTVTSDTNLFDSGNIAPGKNFSHYFASAGNYGYHCRNHPNMQGQIVVTSTASTAFKSIIPRTVTPGSATQGTTQGITQGATQGASSGTQGSSSAKSSASWSEKPLSGQAAAQGKLSQVISFQTNLNQSVGQRLGQSVGQGISPGTSQGQSAVMQYSQYYKITPQAPSKPLAGPTKYELSGQEPTMLYFGGSGSQKSVPYSQYQSYATYIGQNSLWIQGPSSWTQYAAVPQGASLTLLAMTPSGGYGYLYEIYPDGTLDKEGYYFYPYDQIGFYADQVGQHLLMFVIDGQPSNVVVIDVVAYQPPQPIYNYASVTVSSSWLRGYDVYVDGNYQATEGMTGEAPGVVTITVPGDQYHTIAVQSSGFSFSDYRYFSSGWAYTLSV